jgi:Zn-finger nucleic acid-binding protein
MNCPDCGAPMRLEENKDYLSCDYCRSMYFPDTTDEGVRVLGELAEQHCPICDVPLVHAAVSGQRLLYCTRCRGMLLSVTVFTQLLDDLRAQSGHSAAIAHPLVEKDFERRIRCPQCHQQMENHLYGGPGNIVIDTCERCCFHWLDHGEMQRAAHGPDHYYRDDSILSI